MYPSHITTASFFGNLSLKAFALIETLVWIILALEVRIENDSGRK